MSIFSSEYSYLLLGAMPHRTLFEENVNAHTHTLHTDQPYRKEMRIYICRHTSRDKTNTKEKMM